MDFMTAMDISSSGLKAQRAHLNVISMNMANIRTTKTVDGGPLSAQVSVFRVHACVLPV